VCNRELTSKAEQIVERVIEAVALWAGLSFFFMFGFILGMRKSFFGCIRVLRTFQSNSKNKKLPL
jgi:hypothetical protein